MTLSLNFLALELPIQMFLVSLDSPSFSLSIRTKTIEIGLSKAMKLELKVANDKRGGASRIKGRPSLSPLGTLRSNFLRLERPN